MIFKYVLPILAIVGFGVAAVIVLEGNRTPPVVQPQSAPVNSPFTSYVYGTGIVEASTENIAIGIGIRRHRNRLNHQFASGLLGHLERTIAQSATPQSPLPLLLLLLCYLEEDSEEEEELQDQHAIAVAVKTITFANCLLIGTQ